MNYITIVDGFIWLLITLAAMIFLQRLLHREIQAFFLILTRRPGATQSIFALLFLPGIFLHELSHFLMAKLLGVKTGRFSIFPQAMPNGRLRMGYVETEPSGVIREAVIGVAPLLTGCLFIAYFAIAKMELPPLWGILQGGNLPIFWMGLDVVIRKPDFWLWFYFSFVISSTMLPSASDRHAWLPIGLFAGIIFITMIVAGGGPWMLQNLAIPFDTFLGVLAMIFGTSSGLHLVLIPPFFILHKVLAKIVGFDAQ